LLLAIRYHKAAKKIKNFRFSKSGNVRILLIANIDPARKKFPKNYKKTTRKNLQKYIL